MSDTSANISNDSTTGRLNGLSMTQYGVLTTVLFGVLGHSVLPAFENFESIAVLALVVAGGGVLLSILGIVVGVLEALSSLQYPQD